jgi:probable addiction module antidote protein
LSCSAAEIRTVNHGIFTRRKPIGGSISAVRAYRTIGEVEEEYLRTHPEEIEEYLTVLFEEYAQHGNTAALLSSLRAVGRVLGVSRLAESAGLSRKGLQKALSEEGNPYFESVNAIIHAMGYRLVPQKLTDTQRP